MVSATDLTIDVSADERNRRLKERGRLLKKEVMQALKSSDAVLEAVV